MICEKIEFSYPVCTGTVIEAVERLVDDGNPRTWFKHLRARGNSKHQVGRAGKSTAYHLLVAPSAGDRWFSSGRHHGHMSVGVIGRFWPGRTVMRPAYEESLQRYYVNKFADQLARELCGKLVLPYTERTVLFCEKCQLQAEWNENYEKMSCPSHGTRTNLIGVKVHVPKPQNFCIRPR